MSPLVRPLLALATAALLASAYAEDDLLRARLLEAPEFQGKPAACGELQIAPTPEKDSFIKKNELERFHIDPKNPNKFEVKMPNSEKKGEVLVGQRVIICDFHNPDNTIEVNHDLRNQYSPMKVTCKKGCPHGVEVISDQFVIKKLI